MKSNILIFLWLFIFSLPIFSEDKPGSECDILSKADCKKMEDKCSWVPSDKKCQAKNTQNKGLDFKKKGDKGEKESDAFFDDDSKNTPKGKDKK